MIKKLLLAIVICGSMGAGYWWYMQSATYESSFVELGNGLQIKTLSTEPEKDFIRKQFKENWVRLISSPDYDIEYFMGKRGAYPFQPEYEGKMQIKILYKDGQMVGFSGYHMKNETAGTIVFIDIDQAHRGKRYAEVLTRYVVADLKNLGAKFVYFSTGATNLSAQKVYDRIGYERVPSDDKEHVYYRVSFK